MHFWSATQGPLLYAHRGANLEYPENGIAAFRRAIELGADVLELDVHATRDGVFVASHDATGERMAGTPQRIGDCSWSEVSAWDAGWGFVDRAGNHQFRGQGMRLARFDEVLESFPSTPLNVDVKGARPEQLPRLLSVIRATHAEDRVLLTSFERRRISALSRLQYSGPLGLSRRDVVRLVFSPERLSRALGFAGIRAQIPVRSGPFELSRAEFIAKCHRLGLAVDYWVINDPTCAAELLERGADGIVTDDPAVMAEVFRRTPSAAAWRARQDAPRDAPNRVQTRLP